MSATLGSNATTRPSTGDMRTLASDGPRRGLLVVIVNFRTPKLTIDCLRTLAPEVPTSEHIRVVVVDNASGDDSMTQIHREVEREGWGAWCRLVQSPTNGGFAAGNNAGIEACPGAWKYVLLLNSDTLVHAGCLRACIEFMDRDTGIGAFSCRILNGDGSMQNVTRRFPTPTRLIGMGLGLPWKVPRLFEWMDVEDAHWDRERETRDVDWIGGAFMMLRGELIAKIGSLDERFFFYGEDIEICHRVWRSGHRVVYAPIATTTHLGGSSSDPTRMAARDRNVNVWRGRYLTLRLCHGRLAEHLVRVCDVAVCWARLAWSRLTGKGGPDRASHLRELLSVLTGPLWTDATRKGGV